jgi:uncharacterized membrane protein
MGTIKFNEAEGTHMNRKDYLTELYQRLTALPLTREDMTDALQFYEEYFDEAGPEQEQAVIAELGSPAYVAAQIALKLSSSPTPLCEKKKVFRKNTSVAWMIILGIFAAPVALPLALSAGAVLLSLLLAAFSVVLAFSVAGVACIATGLGTALYASVMVFSLGFPTAIYFVGVGLLTLGIGGFLLMFGWWLGGLLVKGAIAIGSRFFSKSIKNEGGAQ